jgi:hypothetical protein
MATTQAVAPISRADSATSVVAIVEFFVVPTSVQAMRSTESATFPGPAKYLLFQVFRI